MVIEEISRESRCINGTLDDNYAALEQRLKELEAELGVWENRETFWDETNKKLEAERDALQEAAELANAKISNYHFECHNLRAENERLHVRLTEQADEYGRQIQSLHLDVAARDGEIEQLKAWKESSIKVENSWDAQQVARLMGLLPGDDIRSNIEPYIRKINAEIVRLSEALKAVADIGFTGEDAVDAIDIAKKALGGGE